MGEPASAAFDSDVSQRPLHSVARLTPPAAYAPARVIGRYAVHAPLASGGMGTVHLGRVLGAGGFRRVVAIKRMNASIAGDESWIAAFRDEARLAGRVAHPNVVATLDALEEQGERLVVMEYVHGVSLAQVLRELRRRRARVPANVASAVVAGVLHGLHAAHEATDERGWALGIVHRDVSPQNVIVGADGTARILDFGIAKAERRLQSTVPGFVKGKRAYLAPEQRLSLPTDRRTDLFAAELVLWEALTGGEVAELASDRLPPASACVSLPSDAIDFVLARALSPRADDRYPTAREMAVAIEGALPPAPAWAVAEWLAEVAPELLEERARRVAAVERAVHPELSCAAEDEPTGRGREERTRAEPRPSRAVDREPVTIPGLLSARQLRARAAAGTLLAAALAIGGLALLR